MLDHESIRKKWQKEWEKDKVNEPEIDKSKEAFYIQVAYPYPSGAMHIGHARTYTITDVIQKYKRMKGYNTLMPMGWHVSGTPVIAGVELIKKRDPKTVKTMTEVFKIPEEDLKELETPEGFVNYFVDKAKTGYKAGFKTLGLGIDWRRELKTIDPQYKKFIQWQYRKLYEKGYVIKGKYPIRYCPHDKTAVGDHDLREGEGVGIQEFTLLKFKLDDGKILVAATLRPETVFGQTNLWINPDIEYSIAKVGNETWILSKEALEKLKYQKDKVEEIGSIKGTELLGKEVEAPGINRKIPILPSYFCNPKIGTGIVTSVPSDAPADYMGLVDLQKDEKIAKKYGLDWEAIKKIEIIPIIKTPKYGDTAAVKICKDMGIKNQFDTQKLEEAKKIVYKEGFHLGVMNENCGKYSGMKVEQAKDKIKKEMIEKGQADIFYELEGPVVCRCYTPVVVRVLDDQWFIKYSDSEWKKESKKTLSKMKIVPELYRQQYENVFDWLEDKPCTRSKGLGTPFPWDETKIIEPLGDSTIYMAYFTISHIIKTIDAEKLTDKVFDYIFLNKGSSDEIAKETGIPKEKLEAMNQNFNYWYPLAFNVSATELIPNHMSFSIFHHTAIFPENKRQKGTLNLGMLIIEGQKMSSSKGNVVLIEDISKNIGVDMVRFFLMNFNEPWQEVDWKPKDVESGVKILENFLEKILEKAKEVKGASLLSDAELSRADRWILSRVNSHLEKANAAIENYELRKFLQEMSFMLISDIKKYEKQADNNAVWKYIIERWTKCLAPFMPHICEEIWHMLGNNSYVLAEQWPEAESKMINPEIEAIEDMLNNIRQDIYSIIKLTKIEQPKKITLYIAPEWKYNFIKSLKENMEKTRDVGALIKATMDKEHGKEISKLVPLFVKNPAKLPLHVLTQKNEEESLKQSKNALEEEFKCPIEIVRAEESKEKKAQQAMPSKPAILIE